MTVAQQCCQVWPSLQKKFCVCLALYGDLLPFWNKIVISCPPINTDAFNKIFLEHEKISCTAHQFECTTRVCRCCKAQNTPKISTRHRYLKPAVKFGVICFKGLSPNSKSYRVTLYPEITFILKTTSLILSMEH